MYFFSSIKNSLIEPNILMTNLINTPLTLALLEYRKMEKLIDAFLVALPKRIEPSTGKIHTSLNQYGAATGKENCLTI